MIQCLWALCFFGLEKSINPKTNYFHFKALYTSGSLENVVGKESTCQCKRCKRLGVQTLGQEDPLEKEMATYSSVLAWKIPWTEEPGGPQSMGKSWTRLSD